MRKIITEDIIEKAAIELLLAEYFYMRTLTVAARRGKSRYPRRIELILA